MNKKGYLTVLLVLCCIVAGVLHVQIDPKMNKQLQSAAQIDSLITQTTFDFRISADQISVRTVELDSVFHRKIYTLNVPPGFSKTTFHHHLHHRLYPLKATLYGEVQFPERDLHLQVVYNNTVHRTVLLRTDNDLIYQSAIIPRLPG